MCLLIVGLRGHATNSYGFTSKFLVFNVLSLFFVSDVFIIVFMVLENHHLQLEILTLRLSAAFKVNPHILGLVSQFWFYTF